MSQNVLTRGIAAVLCIGVACGLLFPSYSQRVQFRPHVDAGWYPFSSEDRYRAYEWIVTNCQPSDVFLCEEQLAARLVGPAGRKAVVTIDVFSNPYVDYDTRMQDKFLMYDALIGKDEDGFREVAADYDVKFLLVLDREEPPVPGASTQLVTEPLLKKLALPFLDEVFRSGPVVIYRVESP